MADINVMVIERKALRQKELDAKKEWEDLQKQRKSLDVLIIERMKHAKIDGIKVDGTNFVPTETIYAQVQDEDTFIAWAKEHDEDLIEEKVRKDPLNQLVRDRLDDGDVPPPGVGFYVDEKISQRAA